MIHESKFKKIRILVVEDEIESQRYFELILRKKFEIDFCDSGNSMYKLLNKNNYDVIMMDISLKDGSNGVDLIKELKSNSSGTSVPVICLSAHIYIDDRLKASTAGADVYLTKPVKRHVLVNAIEELVAVDQNESNNP
jgi:DNA-binding response OmpR family regulator